MIKIMPKEIERSSSSSKRFIIGQGMRIKINSEECCFKVQRKGSCLSWSQDTFFERHCHSCNVLQSLKIKKAEKKEWWLNIRQQHARSSIGNRFSFLFFLKTGLIIVLLCGIIRNFSTIKERLTMWEPRGIRESRKTVTV